MRVFLPPPGVKFKVTFPLMLPPPARFMFEPLQGLEFRVCRLGKFERISRLLWCLPQRCLQEEVEASKTGT